MLITLRVTRVWDCNTVNFIIFPYDQVGRSEGLPSEVIPDYEKDEEFLKKVHHVLLEVGCQEIIKTFI